MRALHLTAIAELHHNVLLRQGGAEKRFLRPDGPLEPLDRGVAAAPVPVLLGAAAGVSGATPESSVTVPSPDPLVVRASSSRTHGENGQKRANKRRV